MNVLLKNLDNIINSLVNKIKDPKIEVELRYGSFYKNQFIPGLDSQTFYSLIKLAKEKKYRIEEIFMIDTFYNNGIRVTDYSKNPPKISKEPEIILKENYNRFDIKPLNIRVDTNIEKEKKKEDIKDAKKIFIREKTRYTLNLQDLIPKYYIEYFDVLIEFTIVKTIENETTLKGLDEKEPKTTYELELEFGFDKEHYPSQTVEDIIKNIDRNQIREIIRTFISFVQQSEFIYGYDEKLKLIEEFNSLSKYKGNRFDSNIVNKPISLNISQYLNIEPNSYYISFKLDGIRKFLYIIKDTIYLIYPPFSINKLQTFKSEFNNTLIDGELFILKDKYIFYAFDILLFKGVDVRNQNIIQRLGDLTKLYEKVNGDKLEFIIKDQHKFGRYEEIRDMIYTYEHLKDKDPKLDGLIFTPIYQFYFNNLTFKWKEPEKLTIDFKVVYKDYKYYIYSYKDKNYVLFEGTKQYPFSGNIKDLSLEKGKIVVGGYEENKIYEFYYDFNEKEFVALGIRYDKLEPNNINVAISNWEIIHQKFDIETIYSKNPTLFKEIYKKEKMKMAFPRNIKSLLDINSFRGGNFELWLEKSLNRNIDFTLVDKDSNLFKRVEYFKLKNTNIINKDFLDIDDKLYPEKVNLVSCYSGLSYFFKDKQTLDKFTEKLSILKNKSYYFNFIGLIFDTESLNNYLKGKEEISNDAFDIKIISQKKSVNFVLNVHKTSSVDRVEYATDLKNIEFKFASIGLVLKKSKLFNTSMFLSEEYNKFLSFNREIYFEFSEKTKPKPIEKIAMKKYISGDIVPFDNKYLPHAFKIIGSRTDGIILLILWTLDLKYFIDPMKQGNDLIELKNEIVSGLKKMIASEIEKMEETSLISSKDIGKLSTEKVKFLDNAKQSILYSRLTLDDTEILSYIVRILEINIVFFDEVNKFPFIIDKSYCNYLIYDKTIIISYLGVRQYNLMGVEYKGKKQVIFDTKNSIIQKIINKMCKK